MNQTKSYRVVASEIPFEHGQKEKIMNTFFAISDYYKRIPNPGACHFISSIFHVLLLEQRIENDLCIGEVTQGTQFFDHSWIEMSGKIFDIAIQLTLNEEVNPPVFASFDLYTETLVDRTYGTRSPIGLDQVAKQVIATPFVKYMNNYGPNGESWKLIKTIGKGLRLKLDPKELPNKYIHTQRNFISNR
jgi:hypothetical protein